MPAPAMLRWYSGRCWKLTDAAISVVPEERRLKSFVIGISNVGNVREASPPMSHADWYSYKEPIAS